MARRSLWQRWIFSDVSPFGGSANAASVIARLLSDGAAARAPYCHLFERQDETPAPLLRQRLPQSWARSKVFAHGEASANAPSPVVHHGRFSAIRRERSIYQRHFVWDIELLFRWIKQHLKLRNFLGRSQNAVKIQIYIAMIGFLLLRLAARDNDCELPAIRFIELAGAAMLSQSTKCEG